ncbi:MAG: LytTR family transcriptional regulator [Saprospiraceae bacterium]|nr:LytTR family transcriptional regulator [Saprospiraceae bacterium]
MSNRDAKPYQALKLLLKDTNGFQLFSFQEIIFIKAERAYSKIYLLGEEPFLCARPLSKIQELINHEVFFRSHNSYLVNLHMIKEYSKKEGSVLILKSGHKIPLAQKRKEELEFSLYTLFLPK